MASLKDVIVFFVFILSLSACSSDIRTLENLGSTDDFNDQEILPDFEAPEDETAEERRSCSGVVNTRSSRLNVRVDASLNSEICGKLESKSTVMISLSGHKNGFFRILTPECNEQFSFVSQNFIGLGSDCTFTTNEETVVQPDPRPTPNPQDPNEIERTPDSLINTFHIERREFNLANGKAKRWDGCEPGYKSTGGYNSDSRCGRAFLHEKFSENLNEQFYKCVFQAADTSGYAKTQKVFINHLGTYNDRNARNSGRKSNHAFARAMDIKNFNLVDERGRVSRVSTLLRDYVGQQARFYDGFRDCWMRSMPSSCRRGNSEYKGSIGHTRSKLGGNSLHNDHIHLSFPLCAG